MLREITLTANKDTDSRCYRPSCHRPRCYRPSCYRPRCHRPSCYRPRPY